MTRKGVQSASPRQAPRAVTDEEFSRLCRASVRSMVVSFSKPYRDCLLPLVLRSMSAPQSAISAASPSLYLELSTSIA